MRTMKRIAGLVCAVSMAFALTACGGGGSADIAKVLTDTFTHVKLVVDPPTQMQRELAALRQGSGALAATEVEGMLALVSRALPDAQVQALQWDGTQLRMKGITLSTEQQGSLQATLRPSRLALSQDGNDWLNRLAP